MSGEKSVWQENFEGKVQNIGQHNIFFRKKWRRRNRLDGKKKRTTSDSGNAVNGVAKAEYVRGIPDYDYVIGTLTFMRNSRPPKQDLSKENDGSKSFEAFKGEGKSLRQAKGNKKWPFDHYK